MTAQPSGPTPVARPQVGTYGSLGAQCTQAHTPPGPDPTRTHYYCRRVSPGPPPPCSCKLCLGEQAPTRSPPGAQLEVQAASLQPLLREVLLLPSASALCASGSGAESDSESGVTAGAVRREPEGRGLQVQVEPLRVGPPRAAITVTASLSAACLPSGPRAGPLQPQARADSANATVMDPSAHGAASLTRSLSPSRRTGPGPGPPSHCTPACECPGLEGARRAWPSPRAGPHRDCQCTCAVPMMTVARIAHRTTSRWPGATC